MLAPVRHGMMVAVMALSLVMGCASSPYVGTGAALGGGLGALTGAAIGHKNPWAGALIGGLVGTGVGAAGGYVFQQRQTAQPQQGYYYQPGPQGYGAPPPSGYGYNAPGPGPSYGGSYAGYNTPNPVTPQYGAAPGSPQYSQNQAPPPSSVHTPISPAPYNTYE